ncbi:hypothetical protein Ancab_037808 [Ancistrocladus abbreviatus]
MFQTPNSLASTRYAVVTGGNKGIGLEICRQLASHGVIIVLTARDPKKGLEALENIKNSSSDLSDRLYFHQLDVTDIASISKLADFIKSKFGKLDILVNNAAINGVILDADAFRASFGTPGAPINFDQTMTQTYELAEECINTNYYGVKRMIEACLPFLQSSDSPRIVNVSSGMGKLKNLHHEWATRIFSSNVENLSEEIVDEVVNVFLKDFKDGSFAEKGWPAHFSAYTVSKSALNAYTRLLAMKYPAISINCVCPALLKQI